MIGKLERYNYIKMHQPKANTHRLYVKMKEVSDLSIIEEAHKSEIKKYCRLLEDKT